MTCPNQLELGEGKVRHRWYSYRRSSLRRSVDLENPDVILENIISTLGYFYLPPFTILPLDNDEDKNGKPPDHLPVVVKHIENIEANKVKYRTITFRPLTDSGTEHFGM